MRGLAPPEMLALGPAELGMFVGLLLVALVVLFAVICGVDLLLRSRYSLAEFVVFVLAVGLGIGLTARSLPEGWSLPAVMAASLGVGVLLFLGGAWGVRAAHVLRIERPGRRMLAVLGGVLLLPAIVGAVAATVAAFHEVEKFPTGKGEGGTLLRALLYSAGALFSFGVVLTMGLLLRRVEKVEKVAEEAEERAEKEERVRALAARMRSGAQREAEEAAAATEGKPVPSPEGEGDGGADREA